VIFDIIAWVIVLAGIAVFLGQFYLAGRFIGRVYGVFKPRPKPLQLPPHPPQDEKPKKASPPEADPKYKINPTFSWES
jgi:hypothetical protein